MDTYFEFSVLLFFIVLILSALIGVILGAVVHWAAGLGTGVGVFCLLYAILGKYRCLLHLIFSSETDLTLLLILFLFLFIFLL